MASVKVSIDTAKAGKALARMADGLHGESSQMGDCLEAVGLAALNDQRKGFIERSKGAAGWPPVSAATAILRKGGGTITSEADVERARRTTPIMRDSGILLDTLSRGASANVFRLGKLSITVGTADRRASVLHRGGETEPFTFGPEREKAFEKKVPKKLSGFGDSAQIYSEATGTHFDPATGRREWKKNKLRTPWNRLYFLWRGIFRKWARTGRRGTAPARPIIVEPTSDQKKRYAQIVAFYVRKLARGE